MIATHLIVLDSPQEVMDLPEPMPLKEAQAYVRDNAHMLGVPYQKIAVGILLTKQDLARQVTPEHVLQALSQTLGATEFGGSIMLATDLPAIHDKFLDFLLEQGAERGLFLSLMDPTETENADSTEPKQNRPYPDPGKR